MKLLGVTGGIGMGKSTAARFLEEAGLPVVDTDKIAKELAGPGQPALDEIVRAFGAEFIDENGELRRRDLGARVFGDAAARARLEAILHPRIRRSWQETAERWRRERVEIGAVVIPLLFETAAESSFDRIICVACSADTQAERLRQRGWALEEIRQRNEAQMAVDKKMTLSDYVIWTEGEAALHQCQIARILVTEGLAHVERISDWASLRFLRTSGC